MWRSPIACGSRRAGTSCASIPSRTWSILPSTLLRQKRLGIFTIGGGVPRNWSQQFGPFIELRHRRMGENVPLKRYHYGLRICPEPVYWGGLSGSPYSEAISWGKFVPPAEGGKFGEVFVDATVGLPLIVAAVLERLGKNGQNTRGRRRRRWRGSRRGPRRSNRAGGTPALRKATAHRFLWRWADFIS